jgi:hypothetical protein
MGQKTICSETICDHPIKQKIFCAEYHCIHCIASMCQNPDGVIISARKGCQSSYIPEECVQPANKVIEVPNKEGTVNDDFGQSHEMGY